MGNEWSVKGQERRRQKKRVKYAGVLARTRPFSTERIRRVGSDEGFNARSFLGDHRHCTCTKQITDRAKDRGWVDEWRNKPDPFATETSGWMVQDRDVHLNWQPCVEGPSVSCLGKQTKTAKYAKMQWMVCMHERYECGSTSCTQVSAVVCYTKEVSRLGSGREDEGGKHR